MDNNAIKNEAKLEINKNGDSYKQSLKKSNIHTIIKTVNNNFINNSPTTESLKQFSKKLKDTSNEISSDVTQKTNTITNNQKLLANSQEILEKYLINIIKNQFVITNNQSIISDKYLDILYKSILKALIDLVPLIKNEINKDLKMSIDLNQTISQLENEYDYVGNLDNVITKNVIYDSLTDTSYTKIKFINSKVYICFSTVTGLRNFVKNIKNNK